MPKTQFKVPNCTEYEAGLDLRDRLTLWWVWEGAVDAWNAASRWTPAVRDVFRRPVSDLHDASRGVQSGTAPSRGTDDVRRPVLGCEVAVPDHTKVGRRTIRLPSITGAALPEARLACADRWHRLVDLRSWRVARRQTGPASRPPVSHAASGSGRRQRPDRGFEVDRPRY